MTRAFNLEEAKAGRKFQTRNGSPARLLGEISAKHYPLVVAIQTTDLNDIAEGNLEAVMEYTINGTEFAFDESANDLRMVVEVKQHWVNVYYNGEGYPWTGGTTYPTEEAAKASADKHYLKTILIHETEL